MNDYRLKRTLIGQLPLGADLYNSVSAIVRRENIRMGRVHGLGATTHARLAYYDQQTLKYNPLEFTGGMEILSLHGNISMRDGQPFAHLHVVLGDAAGRTFGGHLLEGTTVFACELFIDEFDGEEYHRRQEPATGLFLWERGHFDPSPQTGA